MRVSVILARKGSTVATIPPHATLAEAASALAEHDVGALVVSSDGTGMQGILSERDLVRHVARGGTRSLRAPVAEVATTDVTTCGLETTIDELMAMMTERRIRHVPVVADGALAGIVSIGDVVKSRLDELELQAQTLQDYVTGSSA